VNVTIENLSPCKKLVRFEVEAGTVDEAFKTVTHDFRKHAVVPGFRPGKAPDEMILKKYEKDVAEEVKRKLISDSYKQGVKEHKIDVIGYPEIEEIQFGRNQALQFAATVETFPAFEMPEYHGLPANREKRSVTAEDVGRALDALRIQKATFQKVERPLQEGDFAVVNYTGTCEGKPITEIAPVARGLTEQKNFWVEIKKGSFIPGFTEQLVGAKAGEKRTVTIDFPADFVTTQLAGKQGVFEVEVVESKERILPELDEAFAKSYEAESLEVLREGVRSDLQNELNMKQKRDIRNQVVNALLNRVNFDLPESPVQQETRNLVYELVNDYKQRGATPEALDQQKEQIYGLAAQSAKGRVKAMVLFQKVAEKEGIRVSQEEISARVVTLAQSYNMPLQKFVKELESRNGFADIHRELLHEKVINFLQEHARVQDVEPATPAA
jgi:trigger factor